MTKSEQDNQSISAHNNSRSISPNTHSRQPSVDQSAFLKTLKRRMTNKMQHHRTESDLPQQLQDCNQSKSLKLSKEQLQKIKDQSLILKRNSTIQNRQSKKPIVIKKNAINNAQFLIQNTQNNNKLSNSRGFSNSQKTNP